MLIYGLYDPREPGLVMYVGRTRQALKTRLEQHVSSANRFCHRDVDPTYDHRLRGWLRKLTGENIEPCIKLLDEVFDEYDWIDKMRKINPKLLNGNEPKAIAGLAGMHARWHVRRGTFKSDCVWCSGENKHQSGTGSPAKASIPKRGRRGIRADRKERIRLAHKACRASINVSWEKYCMTDIPKGKEEITAAYLIRDKEIEAAFADCERDLALL